MTLTIERLDALASNIEGCWPSTDDLDALIEYARERAARERCEAANELHLTMLTQVVGDIYEAWTEEGPLVEDYASADTMAGAYLALAAALEKR